jgi:hypothetical protein
MIDRLRAGRRSRLPSNNVRPMPAAIVRTYCYFCQRIQWFFCHQQGF